MTANISLNDSDGHISQHSDEINSDNNSSENEDLNTESDIKSTNSHDDSYSNATLHSDVIVPQIDNVITKDKKFFDYGIDDGNMDIQKSISFRKHCCTIVTLLLGLGLFAWGLVTIVIPIYDFVLVERLKMEPGYPPFEQWVIPSPEVRLSVYIFSVENPATFLDGTDEKLRLIEIGPIVYREYLHHQNIEHHENSTLSYTAARRVEFLVDQNEPGILERYILVPNFVLLATAASLNNDYWKKKGFNGLLFLSGDPMFLNMTINDYLWNYQSDFLQNVEWLAPTNNSGVLYQMYQNFDDRYNVRVGPNYSYDHFFEITSVNGGETVPGFDLSRGECNASVVGSTEGALYKNHLTENSVLWYWRKPLCRQVPLHYEKKVQKGPFDCLKFVLREDVYDRMENQTNDCYKGFFQTLPDGLSDVSKCFYNMPFAASNPHFYGRYPNNMTHKLDGLKPDRNRHQSFIIVEPIMGIPIDQSARSQSNVIIPNLSGFSENIERFSNMALPTFWVEYHQKQLTPKIETLLYFTLNVLPVLQYVISAILLILGATCLTIGVQRCMDWQSNEKTVSSKFSTNCKLHEAEIAWNLK